MTTSPAHFLNMLKFSTGLNALSLTQFGGDSFDKFSVVLTGARIRQALTPANVAAKRIIKNPLKVDFYSERAKLIPAQPPMLRAGARADYGAGYDFEVRDPRRMAPRGPVVRRGLEDKWLNYLGERPVSKGFDRVNPSDLADLRYAALKRKRPSFNTPEINAARQVEQGKRLFGLDLDLFPTPPSKSAVLQTRQRYVNAKDPSIDPKPYYEGDPIQHYPARTDGRLPEVEVGIGHKSMLENRQGGDIFDVPWGRTRPPQNRYGYDSPLNPDSVPGTADFPYVRVPLSEQGAEDSLRAALWRFGNRLF